MLIQFFKGDVSMRRKVKDFIIENNGETILNTNKLIFTLTSTDGNYLGIITFLDNKLPEDDETLFQCCQWKANEEMPWKYEFYG